MNHINQWSVEEQEDRQHETDRPSGNRWTDKVADT